MKGICSWRMDDLVVNGSRKGGYTRFIFVGYKWKTCSFKSVRLYDYVWRNNLRFKGKQVRAGASKQFTH